MVAAIATPTPTTTTTTTIITNTNDDLNACTAGENYSAQEGSFEGPEKLLELWFASSPPTPPPGGDQQQYNRGLLAVPRPVWEDMLAIVKCTVLNMIQHDQVNAYLLSESSMFVYPHKLIIKTCGTTTLLLALPRILTIAKDMCGFDQVWRVFYSRKAFMFPDRQVGPHTSWESEVAFLDQYFDDGSAYKIGNLTGDHWHLYTTKPPNTTHHYEFHEHVYPVSGQSTPITEHPPTQLIKQQQQQQHHHHHEDQTVEILMTQLNPDHMERYFYHQQGQPSGVEGGQQVDAMTGIDQLYPSADVDSFLFEPCGYSSNGLLGHHYFTIHVTPEPNCSYASFETNIPTQNVDRLVKQVLRIFDPASFTVTLFTSHQPHPQQMVSTTVNHKDGYQRTDRILYEFDGYDLVYGHYVKKRSS